MTHRAHATAVLLLVCFASACADENLWGDLTVRFIYDGIPPRPVRLADSLGEAFCGDLTLVDERLLVDSVNKGVRNVVVYVYEGQGGMKLPAIHPEASSEGKLFELANVNCNYVPRVLVMKSNDELSIVNTDVIGYNVMLGFIANESRNFSLPPKSDAKLVVEKAEPAPIPIECTIFPWMKARVLVLDHRYSAISSTDGKLQINNLPAGTRLAFRIYHEAADLRGVKVGQGEVNRRGIFEVVIVAGQNDLGTIKLPPAAFSSN